MAEAVHTADKVVAQLRAEIAAANAATGAGDATVHDAVARLIAGYGSGGGVSLDAVTVFVADFSDASALVILSGAYYGTRRAVVS